MKSFNCFIGIDQTGATNSSGSPKPLPCFAIVSKNNKWWFVPTKTSLAHLSHFQHPAMVEFFLNADLGPMQNWESLILVDCVLGLPQVLSDLQTPPMEQLKAYMRQAAQTPSWGLRAGQNFFDELLRKHRLRDLPRRQSEIQLKANSVFTHQPFQKNIQTGTFRIWKDLGSDLQSLSNFLFWPFETLTKPNSHPVIAEGYPSLAWQYLGNGRRNSQTLGVILDRFRSQIEGLAFLTTLNKDQLDAAMLALWGWYTMQNNLITPIEAPDLEGQIWGQTLQTADLK